MRRYYLQSGLWMGVLILGGLYIAADLNASDSRSGQSETVTLSARVELQVSTAPCPDFDGNGRVDTLDFLLFVGHFGISRGDEGYEAKYDLDGNDTIGIPDFLIFTDNFGKEVNCASVPVPVTRFADIEHAAWLERNRPALANQLKGLSWVADGVEDSELEAAEALIAAARWYPVTFSALLEKPWVGDSITLHETTAITRIRFAAKYAPELAQQILQKSWVQDGIARDEAAVIYYLYWTVRAEDEFLQQAVIETAIEILAMSFLDTVESPDALTLRSLERYEDAGSQAFLDLMAHPNVKDGITDKEAKTFVVLGATNERKPESVPILLNNTGVHLEERVVNLPHSGEVLLAIIRLRDHSNSGIDFLEHAVRNAERFMGEPLPTNYVAWYFDDATSAEGTNYQTHITSQPYYDDPNDDRWSDTPRHIAHEVGHHYWSGSGSQRWIKEGGADLLAYLAENDRIGRPIETDRSECSFFDNISELEAADPERGTDKARCYYSLGSRLFVDLYHDLGEDTFQQGFRGLYLKRLQEDPYDDCEGIGLGICHLEAAFKAGASDQTAAKVDEVLGRWYGSRP